MFFRRNEQSNPTNYYHYFIIFRPQVAMATAQVLFQRFFYVASLKKFSVRVCVQKYYTHLFIIDFFNRFFFLILYSEKKNTLSLEGYRYGSFIPGFKSFRITM